MKLELYPPPVYFMHIPKTAGTSFRQFMNLVYRKRRTFEVYSNLQLQNMSEAEIKNFDCYLCHRGASLYNLVGRDDLPCITILRDPVERLISALYFRQWRVKQIPHIFVQEWLDLMVPLQDADLRTLLSTPVLAELERDVQTQDLGIDSSSDLRRIMQDGSGGGAGRPHGEDPLERLSLLGQHDMNQAACDARQRLERMAVVGVTERYDEFMELVCDLLGVPVPDRSPQTNLGPRKTAVDVRGYRTNTPPDLVEQVEELTVHDRELYAYACELQEQQYARYRARPRRTYSIAPRLLMPARKMALASSAWIQSRYPGATDSPPLRWLRSRARRVL